MADSTLWWLLAGLCIAAELATGTFYLLMVALGFSAAALATYLGAGQTAQIVTAAVVGGGAVAIWYAIRSRRPAALSANANLDVNLDIGETLQVAQWQADGTAAVQYRGARWTVQHTGDDVPSPGLYKVVALVGSRLIVDKA